MRHCGRRNDFRFGVLRTRSERPGCAPHALGPLRPRSGHTARTTRTAHTTWTLGHSVRYAAVPTAIRLCQASDVPFNQCLSLPPHVAVARRSAVLSTRMRPPHSAVAKERRAEHSHAAASLGGREEERRATLDPKLRLDGARLDIDVEHERRALARAGTQRVQVERACVHAFRL